MPDAGLLSAAPVESARSDVEPVVVTKIVPLEAIEPSEIDCALFSVKAPTVPLVATAPIAFAPVRLSVPPPLSASVPAVIVPAPFSVAPLATEIVSVPDEPTFKLPESVNVPALTVVAPV